MTVLRIVANLSAPDPDAATAFYRDLLGLELGMDHGWIKTFVSPELAAVQISIASEAAAMDLEIAYPLTDEPWGVRRFYVRDPLGTLINILSHTGTAD